MLLASGGILHSVYQNGYMCPVKVRNGIFPGWLNTPIKKTFESPTFALWFWALFLPNPSFLWYLVLPHKENPLKILWSTFVFSSLFFTQQAPSNCFLKQLALLSSISFVFKCCWNVRHTVAFSQFFLCPWEYKIFYYWFKKIHV